MLNPLLTRLMADARIADLQESAVRSPAAISGAPPPARTGNRNEGEPITIRFAGAADERMLERLAQMDSAAPPTPPVLIAEVGGETRAALSLQDAAMIADPFHRTAGLQQLLLARAAQLRGNRPARWPRRLLRRATARARAASPGAAMAGAASQPHR
jgi:hypothetical protein